MSQLLNKNILIMIALSLTLTACGGGSAGSMADGDDMTEAGNPNPSPDPDPVPVPVPDPLPELEVTNLNLAQSHVIPADGKRWSQKSADGDPRDEIELHLTGGRPALALIDVTPNDVANMQVEGQRDGTSLGTVELLGNDELPPTESDGPRFSDTAMIANLPGNWLEPGLQIRVTATTAMPSDWQDVNVGATTDFAIRSLPMYFFGADETTVPLAEAARPDEDQLDEIYAKWSMSTIEVPTHPATKVEFPYLIVPPRNGNSAYRMNSTNDQKVGFDTIAAARSIYGDMRVSGGEQNTAVQYYASLVLANAEGNFSGVGGGLGGGHVGAGDHLYQGIFIHEQGHAFGLGHAGESFDGKNGGEYPYTGGSLDGSNWSYDQPRNVFQPTLVPSNASRFANCRSNSFGGTARQVDDQGRCIRQDPMQSGSGDQAAGDAYSTFADYHAGRMQRYFEGLASDDDEGNRSYSGGRVFESTESSTGYRRWDSIDLDWVEVDNTLTFQNGLYGVQQNYPIATDTPIYTIALTISFTDTADATQIYPIIGPYSGNLITTFDPTNADDRADITINTGTHAWYCRNTGCDYTVKVTYANNTVRHIVVPQSFRPFFPNGDTPPRTEASDPTSGQSFLLETFNVPADAAITKVEILDTPKAWEGLAENPEVLATRTLP